MRLIDAEALENEIVKTMRYVPKDAVLDVACMVNRAPTIEAKPVVHAHWEKQNYIDMYYTEVHCSSCGKRILAEHQKEYKYCPHCGAQMDEIASDTNVGSKGVKIPVMSMKDICRKIMCDR